MKKKGNRANTPNRANEPKFKPGPWKYDPRTNEILNDNRYPIAEYVLELENGNLIAAAPDMYNSNETTLQEITEIFSGLNAACGKCMRYLEIGNKACRTCAAHKTLKIAEQMKNRISKLQQKARGEQEE